MTVARAGREDAGTTLNNLLKDAGANGDAASFKKVIDFVANSDDPSLQNKAKFSLQSMEKQDPKWAESIGKALNEKTIENETLHSQLLKDSSKKVSTEAELGLQYNKDGTTIGGKVTAGTKADLQAYANDQLKKLDQTAANTNELQSQLKSGKAQSGGAETAVIGIVAIERGDAPHIFHNSLLYQAPPAAGGGK